MATPFNQGAPTIPVVLNTSNCFVFGNTASGNALSVQQLGAGNVATFRTTTGATALFVNAAGNVGIGTTSPGTPLDVTGRIRTTQDLMVESTAAGANYSVMRVTTGGDGNNYIQSAAAQSGGSSANLIFTGWFGSPESMRIASTGRVGIGTASPTSNAAVDTAGIVRATKGVATNCGSVANLGTGGSVIHTFSPSPGGGHALLTASGTGTAPSPYLFGFVRWVGNLGQASLTVISNSGITATIDIYTTQITLATTSGTLSRVVWNITYMPTPNYLGDYFF